MISRGSSFALVTERIPQTNFVNHCVATEIIMEALAIRLGLSESDVERWAIAGLLHDVDYSQTADDPSRHGLLSVELLGGSVDEEMAHAILAHAGHADRVSLMDHALWCADPTTGFIVAAALVRPEKDLGGVQVKSLKKRWKESSFAKGANRDQMAGHVELGIERDEFLELALVAMQARAGEIGF
jgi:putative nucleotidyltransferase with HDIG domain